MQTRTLEFDLYFDETGEFLETSTIADERKKAKQRFPSQLAGFLVPHGDIEAEAKAVIHACKRSALLRPEESFKGSKLSDRQLARFVRQLVAEFEKRPEWKPVRIVNQEAVSYGDQVAAYTNIFAELILRILQQKSIEEPDANISIRAYGTMFMRGGYYSTKPHEYLNRVFEYLKFLAVRRGLAPESNRWTLAGLVLNFGRERPELLIADILSNASHNDFKKLDFSKRTGRRSPVVELLIGVFADRNWTLAVRELFERVSLLTEEYSYGMALIAIAEAIGEGTTRGHDANFVAKAKEKVADINYRLVRMGARGRDPQLATVLNWLDQVIGHQRLAAIGYRLARWFLSNVAEPLRELLRDEKERESVEWFEYAVRRWALTAANHQGKLFEAERETQAMRRLAPRLARHWERAPILFDGLIAQAIHLTDAFEFDRVSNDMRLVAKAMETQSDLFSNYRGGEFPDPIRFDLRAKAVGTLLQNEMFKGLSSENEIRAVREFSDSAIEEFEDPKDKARQYQYRCHLETIAGDLDQARRYLIWSIREAQTNEADFSHMAIRRILPEANDNPGWGHDFTISHWLRLGGKICLQQHVEEGDFWRAYRELGLSKFYLESSKLADHPIHNILRYIAVIDASHRHFNSAIAALKRLQELDPIGKYQFNFALVMAAGQAEVAGLMWDVDRAGAARLLDHTGELDGLKQLFSRMRAANVNKFPRAAGVIDSFAERIERLGSRTPAAAAKQTLIEIGSEIRF